MKNYIYNATCKLAQLNGLRLQLKIIPLSLEHAIIKSVHVLESCFMDQ